MAREPVHDVYRQDLPADRSLTADDIARLRFGITLRGYAMEQVDDVLDRLAREIAERDALIAELRACGPGPRPGPPAEEIADAPPAASAARPEVTPHEIPADR